MTRPNLEATYAFGDFVLDGARRELSWRGKRVRIEPKVLDLVLYLVRHRERVVPRDEILEALWPGETISDAALGYCVKSARKAVRDSGDAQHTIATVQRRGLRFVAETVESPRAAPQLESSSPRAAVGTVPPAGGFFVGREPVMARLRGALAAIRSGRGRVVLLTGEPGIRKTRTAEELARFAAEEGVEVLFGRCHEGAAAPPFWPWVQILREYVARRDQAAVLETMGRAASDLVQLVPELGPHGTPTPTPSQPPPDSEDVRFRLFDGITTFLRRAARAHPLVLVLDDLHWADTPSLLLLSFLARELEDAPLLVVATFRDTDVPAQHALTACVAQIARARGSDRIQLEGLTNEDLARFLEATTGSVPPPSLVQAIHEQTGGNPFFATETARVLLAEGNAGDLTHARVSVPRTVRETVARRLEALSTRTQHLLRAAAVIGREFDLALLARIREGARPLSRQGLLDGLDEAIATRLIEPSGPQGSFRFTHALVRETVYESLASADRVRLHAEVGTAIAALHANDPGPHLAALAHHFAAAAVADDPRRAIDYAIRAGDRAATMFAYEEAAAHYARAVELLEKRGGSYLRVASPNGDALDDVRFRLGEILWKSGEFGRAKEAFREVARRAREARSATQLARAALGFGGGFRGFDFGIVEPELVALLEEALHDLPARPSPLRARVMARLAVALYSVPGSLERRQELSSQAVRIAERTGDTASQLAAPYSRHWALWGPDTLADRLDAAQAMLQLAIRAGDRENALHAHRFRLIDPLECGDLAGVDGDLTAFVRLAEELRQPYYHWFAARMRAMRALLAGRIEESERLTEEALIAGRRAESRNVEPVYWSQMLWIRREQGRLDELEPMLRTAVEHFPALPAWRCALTLVLGELGRSSEARAHLELLAADNFGVIPRNAFWLASLTGCAEACADIGDRAHAASLYDVLAPYAGRIVEATVGAACLGAVDRSLGRLAAILGRRDDALRHLAQGLAAEQRLAAPLLIARTERARAAVLAERRRQSG